MHQVQLLKPAADSSGSSRGGNVLRLVQGSDPIPQQRHSFTVRTAQPSDEAAFAEVERAAFGATGIEPYGQEHFRTWLKVHPEAFLVAETGGQVVGYTYSQRVNFNWSRLNRFENFDRTTGRGYTEDTHDRTGNAFQGVSIASTCKGAGRALFDATFRLMECLGMDFYVGLSRISGFAQYARSLEGTRLATRNEEMLTRAARAYALKCAMMAQTKVWSTAHADGVGLYPEPAAPDAVLTAHLRDRPNFGLARVVPDCMHDDQSLNYAAVIVRQF